MNRDFAKIVDGRVQFADDYVKLYVTVTPPDGEPYQQLMRFSNPTEAQYREAGYLPVVEAQRPADGDGYHYEEGYELGHDDTTDTDEIVQVWERVDDPPPDPNPEISAERALGIILTGRDSDET